MASFHKVEDCLTAHSLLERKKEKREIHRYFKGSHSKYVHILEGEDWFGVFSLWAGDFLSTCLCKSNVQLFDTNLNLAWASQALCMLFDL